MIMAFGVVEPQRVLKLGYRGDFPPLVQCIDHTMQVRTDVQIQIDSGDAPRHTIYINFDDEMFRGRVLLYGEGALKHYEFTGDQHRGVLVSEDEAAEDYPERFITPHMGADHLWEQPAELSFAQWMPIFEALTGLRVMDRDGFTKDNDATYTIEEAVTEFAKCTVGGKSLGSRFGALLGNARRIGWVPRAALRELEERKRRGQTDFLLHMITDEATSIYDTEVWVSE